MTGVAKPTPSNKLNTGSGTPFSYVAFILGIAYIKDNLVVIPEKPRRLYIKNKLEGLRSYFGRLALLGLPFQY